MFSLRSFVDKYNKLGEIESLIQKMTLTPPTSEHFPQYKEMLNCLIQSILEEMIFQLASRFSNYCSEEESWVLLRAFLFDFSDIGDCSHRASYAALKLQEIFKDTDIKVYFKYEPSRDHYFVILENKENQFVYDPLINPEIIFTQDEFEENILPLFLLVSSCKFKFNFLVAQEFFVKYKMVSEIIRSFLSVDPNFFDAMKLQTNPNLVVAMDKLGVPSHRQAAVLKDASQAIKLKFHPNLKTQADNIIPIIMTNRKFCFFDVPSSKLRYVQKLQQTVGAKEIKFSKKSPSRVKMSLSWLKQLPSNARDELAYGAHAPEQCGEDRTGAGISRKFLEKLTQNKKRSLDCPSQSIKKPRSIFSECDEKQSEHYKFELQNNAWLSVFRTILASCRADLIQESWDSADDLFKDSFLRKKIILGTVEHPYLFQISITECLKNFRSSLRSQTSHLISLIWKFNSKELILLIQDDPDRDVILDEVRNSSRNGRSDVITAFEIYFPNHKPHGDEFVRLRRG